MENGWVGEVKSCGWGDGMRGGDEGRGGVYVCGRSTLQILPLNLAATNIHAAPPLIPGFLRRNIGTTFFAAVVKR